MKKYKIYYEDDKASKPRPHEDKIAKIATSYFKSDVVFMRRTISKTPDIYVLKTNIRWEIKSPTGDGKHTIQNNLREAAKQSENIIIDLSRTKINTKQCISKINHYFKNEHANIKRILIVEKTGNVVDFKS